MSKSKAERINRVAERLTASIVVFRREVATVRELLISRDGDAVKETLANSGLPGAMAALGRLVLPWFIRDAWMTIDLVVQSPGENSPASSASGVGAPSGSNPSANP